ncbi:Uncharacterised protein [BD1-7 clade bacterium]|uniref:TcdA/TcdB toxin pore forming domain-containing protein n=1 Tax=BD1-7 clade bacterium TaxID=2029982 RepID=A0A5S9QMJ4_9GAMM|nr:Uncharacterised protein [BD1-7 clade bacterium]
MDLFQHLDLLRSQLSNSIVESCHGFLRIRSRSRLSDTCVLIAHGESTGQPVQLPTSFTALHFAAPEGHRLLGQMGAAVSLQTPLAAPYNENTVDELALSPLSVADLLSLSSSLADSCDVIIPTQTQRLSALLIRLADDFQGALSIYCCRSGSDTSPVFVDPKHDPSQALMAFGTTSGGVPTSVDTGNIAPGSEAYTHYVASYLSELADDVATAQNPKLNTVDLGWIKQSTNLRAFADGRIQHFAEEISAGRQLGYFDKSLVTRLASFRQGIESILGHPLRLGVDTESAPAKVPGHDLIQDRLSLENALTRVEAFVGSLSPEQQNQSHAFSSSDLAAIEQLKSDIDSQTLPLSKASPEAFQYLRQADALAAGLSESTAGLTAAQQQSVSDWNSALTPGLTLASLQDKGAQVVLEGEPIARDSGDTNGFSHVYATNVKGLYIGYNDSPDEAKASVAQINQALDVSNPDHNNFATQLYGAASLSALNDDGLGAHYGSAKGARGFVFGQGDAADAGVTAVHQDVDGGLRTLVSAATDSSHTGTQGIADTYSALAKVISQSSFATVETAADGSVTAGSGFAANIDDTHTLRWTATENQAAATGVGYLGPDPDTIGEPQAIGQMSANSYLAANKEPARYSSDGDQLASSFYNATAIDSSVKSSNLPKALGSFADYQEAATYLNQVAGAFNEIEQVSTLRDTPSVYDRTALSKAGKRQLRGLLTTTPDGYESEYSNGGAANPNAPDPSALGSNQKLMDAIAIVATESAASPDDGIQAAAKLTAVLDASVERKYAGLDVTRIKNGVMSRIQKIYGEESSDSKGPIATQFKTALVHASTDGLYAQDFGLSGLNLPEGGLVSQPYQDKVGLLNLAETLGEDTSGIAAIKQVGAADYARVINNFLVSTSAADNATDHTSDNPTDNEPAKRFGFDPSVQLSKALTSTVHTLLDEGGSPSHFLQGVIDASQNPELDPNARLGLQQATAVIRGLSDADEINGQALNLSAEQRQQLVEGLGEFTPKITLNNAVVADGSITYVGTQGIEVAHGTLPVLGLGGTVEGYQRLTLQNGDVAYVSTDDQRPSFTVKDAFNQRIHAAVSNDDSVTPADVTYSFQYLSAQAEQPGSGITQEDVFQQVGEKLQRLAAGSGAKNPDASSHAAYSTLLGLSEDALLEYQTSHSPAQLQRALQSFGPDLTSDSLKQFAASTHWLSGDDVGADPKQIKTSFDYFHSHLGEPDEDIASGRFGFDDFAKLIVTKLKALEAAANAPISINPSEAEARGASSASIGREINGDIAAKVKAQVAFQTLLQETKSYASQLADDNPAALDGLFLAVGRRFKDDSPFSGKVKSAIDYTPEILIPGRFKLVDSAVNVGEFNAAVSPESAGIFKTFVAAFAGTEQSQKQVLRLVNYSRDDVRPPFGQAGDYYTALKEVVSASNIISDDAIHQALPASGKTPPLVLEQPFDQQSFVARLNNAATVALTSYAEKGIDASAFVEGLSAFAEGSNTGSNTGSTPQSTAGEDQPRLKSILKTHVGSAQDSPVGSEQPVLSNRGLLGIFEHVTAIDGKPLIIDPGLRAHIAAQRAAEGPDTTVTGPTITDLYAQGPGNPLYEEGVAFNTADGTTATGIPLVHGDLSAPGYTRFTLTGGDQLYVNNADEAQSFRLTANVSNEIQWLTSDSSDAGDSGLVSKSLAYHNALVAEGSETPQQLDDVLINKVATLANADAFAEGGYRWVVNALTKREHTLADTDPSQAIALQQRLKAQLHSPDEFIAKTARGDAAITEALNNALPELDAQHTAKQGALAVFAHALGVSDDEINGLDANREGYAQVIATAKDQAQTPDGFTLVEPTEQETAALSASFDKRLAAAFSDSYRDLVNNAADVDAPAGAQADYLGQKIGRADFFAEPTLASDLDYVTGIDGKPLTLSSDIRSRLAALLDDPANSHTGEVAASVTVGNNGQVEWLDSNNQTLDPRSFEAVRFDGSAQGYEQWQFGNGEVRYQATASHAPDFILGKQAQQTLGWLQSDDTRAGGYEVEQSVRVAQALAQEQGPVAVDAFHQDVIHKFNVLDTAGATHSEAYDALLHNIGVGQLDSVNVNAPVHEQYQGQLGEQLPLIDPRGNLVGYEAQRTPTGTVFQGEDGQYSHAALANGDQVFFRRAGFGDQNDSGFIVKKAAWDTIAWLSNDAPADSPQQVADAVHYAQNLSHDRQARFSQGDLAALVNSKLARIADSSKASFSEQSTNDLLNAVGAKEATAFTIQGNQLALSDSARENLSDQGIPAISVVGDTPGYHRLALSDGRDLYVSSDAGHPSFTVEQHIANVLRYFQDDDVSLPPDGVQAALRYANAYAEANPQRLSGAQLNEAIRQKLASFGNATDSPSFQTLVDGSGLVQVSGTSVDNGALLGTEAEREHDTRFSQLPVLDGKGDAQGFRDITLDNGDHLYLSDSESTSSFVLKKSAYEEVTWLQSSTGDLVDSDTVAASYRYSLGLVESGKQTLSEFHALVKGKLQSLGDRSSPGYDFLKTASATEDVANITVDASGVHYLSKNRDILTSDTIPRLDANGDATGYSRYALGNGETLFLADDDSGKSFALTGGLFDAIQWLKSDNTTASADVVARSSAYFKGLAAQGGAFTDIDYQQLVDNKLQQFSTADTTRAASESFEALLKDNAINSAESLTVGGDGQPQFTSADGRTLSTDSLPSFTTNGAVTGDVHYKTTTLVDGSILYSRESGVNAADNVGPKHFVLSESVHNAVSWLGGDKTTASAGDIQASVEYAKSQATTSSARVALVQLLGDKLQAVAEGQSSTSTTFKTLASESQAVITSFNESQQGSATQLYDQLKTQFDVADNAEVFDAAFPEVAVSSAVTTISRTVSGLQQTGNTTVALLGQLLGDSDLRESRSTDSAGLSNMELFKKLSSSNFEKGIGSVLSSDGLGTFHDYLQVLGKTVAQEATYGDRIKQIQHILTGDQVDGALSPSQQLSAIKAALPEADSHFTPEVAKQVRGLRESVTTQSKETSESLLSDISDIQAKYQATEHLQTQADSSASDLAGNRANTFAHIAEVAARALPEGIDLPVPDRPVASITGTQNPITRRDFEQAIDSTDAQGGDRSLLVLHARQLGARLESSVAKLVADNNLNPDDVPVLSTLRANVPKPSTSLKGEALDLKTTYDVDFYNPTTQKLTVVSTTDSTLSEVRTFLDDNTNIALGHVPKVGEASADKPSGQTRSLRDLLKTAGSGDKDDTDVAGANTLNAAFSVQALIGFIERKKVEKVTGDPSLAKALRAHEDLNAARIVYGTVLDAAHVASAFKTLYKQSTRVGSAVAESETEAGEAAASSAGTVFSTAGQIGVGGIDLLFSAASTGLDIYELTKAKTDTEKATIGTQLAFDAAGTVIGATSLGLGIASAAGVTAAGVAGAALGGVGVIFAGLGVGIAALVDAYGQVLDQAEQLGKYFSAVEKTYKNNGFTYNSKTNTLTTAGEGAVDEVNFRTGKVTYGNTKLQSIDRTKNDKAATRNIIWWGGVPEDDTNPRDDFTAYAGLGYGQHVNISHPDATTIVAPVVPHSRFYDYTYNSDPGSTTQHKTGFDVLRHFEKTENFDFDFYASPTEWILQTGKQKFYNTTIKIVLDDKARAVVVPKIPDSYKGYVSHHIQGDGANYVVAVGDHDRITLDSDAGKRSTWVISTNDLTDSNISLNSHIVYVGDAQVQVNDRYRSSVLIDDKQGDTFSANFSDGKALAVVINGKNFKTHAALVAHIDSLRHQNRLGTQIKITNYQGPQGVKLDAAIYDVAGSQFITGSLVSSGASLLRVIQTNSPTDLLASSGSGDHVALFSQNHQLVAYDLKTRQITAHMQLPQFVGDLGSGSGARLVGVDNTHGLHLIYQGAWKGSSTITYQFDYNNTLGRFELDSIYNDDALYKTLKNGQPADLHDISERLSSPVALASIVSVTDNKSPSAYIRGADGEVIKPTIDDGTFVTDHVYRLNGNPGTISQALNAVKDPGRVVGEGAFRLNDGQTLDFHDSPGSGNKYHDLWSFFEGKATGEWYHKNLPEQADDNLVHELSGRIYLEKGTHKFSFRHDDGLKFSVGGKTLINDSNYDHGKWSKYYDFTAATSGYYDIAGVYTQAGGAAGLTVHIDDKALTVEPPQLELLKQAVELPGQLLNAPGAYFNDRVSVLASPPTSVDEALTAVATGKGVVDAGDYQLSKLDFSQSNPHDDGLTSFFGNNAKRKDGDLYLGAHADINVLHQISGRLFLKAGTHKFTVRHDDGLRLQVGDQTLINSNSWDKKTPQVVTYTQAKDGYVTLGAAYYQDAGAATFKVAIDGTTVDTKTFSYQPDRDATNLIKNGSFEQFKAIAGDALEGEAPGWTSDLASWVDPSKHVVVEHEGNSTSGPAKDGNRILDIEFDTVSQTFDTIPGKTYQLSFSQAPSDTNYVASPGHGVKVLWNGKVVETTKLNTFGGWGYYPGQKGWWQNYHYSLKATSNKTTLGFSGASNQIDAVSVRDDSVQTTHDTALKRPLVYLDKQSHVLYVQSGDINDKAKRITLGAESLASQHVDSSYYLANGNLVAKASDGNIWQINPSGAATLQILGSGWLSTHHDWDASVSTLLGKNPPEYIAASFAGADNKPAHALYNTANKSWLFYPPGEQRAQLVGLSSTQQSGWFYDSNTKTLFSGALQTSKSLGSVVVAGSLSNADTKTHTLLSGYSLSKFVHGTSGFSAQTSDGLEIDFTTQGALLTGLSAAWVSTHGNKLPANLGKLLKSADGVSVFDSKGRTQGWVAGKSGKYFALPSAAGGASFIGVSNDGSEAYATEQGSDGTDTLYALSSGGSAKADRLFSDSYIAKLGGDNPSLLVQLNHGSEVSRLPSLAGVTQITVAAASGDQIDLSADALAQYHSVHIDFSALTSAAKSTSLTLSGDVITADTVVTESSGDLTLFNAKTKRLIVLDGANTAGAKEVSLHIGDLPKTTLAALNHYVAKQGVNIGSNQLQGEVWAIGRAPTSIADAQGLIAKKTGTDYTIHKLAFNDVRNAKGELTGDNLGTFFGTNATLKSASGAVTLKSVDTDLIHRITGNIYLSAGDHQLSIQHDDGLQLSLGGQQLVNKVGWDGDKPETANFHAAKAGFYPLHALYYQAGGAARFDVKVDGKTLSSEGGAEGVKGVPLSSVYAELTLSHNSEQHLPAKGAVDQLLAAVGNKTLGSQLAEHKSIASVDADKQHPIDTLVQAIAGFKPRSDVQLHKRDLNGNDPTGGLAVDPNKP